MKSERFDPTRYLVAPDIRFDETRTRAFEEVFRSIRTHPTVSFIEYTCEYPKFEFLTYLVQRKNVLLCGSNDPGITCFEPRQQTDFYGRVRESVFATDDGIWPMYFAIVDRDRVKVLRNACFEAANEHNTVRTYYLFAVPAKQLKRHPWREGTVYILPRDTFTQAQVKDSEGRLWKEWASDEPVTPLAKLTVTTDDFPFLDDMQGFRLLDILIPALIVVGRQLLHRFRCGGGHYH